MTDILPVIDRQIFCARLRQITGAGNGNLNAGLCQNSAGFGFKIAHRGEVSLAATLKPELAYQCGRKIMISQSEAKLRQAIPQLSDKKIFFLCTPGQQGEFGSAFEEGSKVDPKGLLRTLRARLHVALPICAALAGEEAHLAETAEMARQRPLINAIGPLGERAVASIDNRPRVLSA